MRFSMYYILSVLCSFVLYSLLGEVEKKLEYVPSGPILITIAVRNLLTRTDLGPCKQTICIFQSGPVKIGKNYHSVWSDIGPSLTFSTRSGPYDYGALEPGSDRKTHARGRHVGSVNAVPDTSACASNDVTDDMATVIARTFPAVLLNAIVFSQPPFPRLLCHTATRGFTAPPNAFRGVHGFIVRRFGRPRTEELVFAHVRNDVYARLPSLTILTLERKIKINVK